MKTFELGKKPLGGWPIGFHLGVARNQPRDGPTSGGEISARHELDQRDGLQSDGQEQHEAFDAFRQLNVNGERRQGTLLEPMKASLHQPFFTIVADTLIERHVISRNIGYIDSPTRKRQGLINGCGISLKLDADLRGFDNSLWTVGLGTAPAEVFFFERERLLHFQSDESLAFAVLDDFLRPLAKLFGGFILLGFEALELSFGLLDSA